ncbi:right-handed parallel beta-helix repeat-containing protein [Erythrobacter crassostreae]|uniref:Right-handed parallel beta-helix repeat-containing protein n=1 Tax=Erythrobacter crassostreae TaxID=2828328 RepID=A0A9X1F1W5_9SPHN|nr:right-handed parallel beta-helix repeat-containing protein [Erythrobacter crassostrea]MBV7258777.1 right-handed parallel beta-helix repeat-containing protein [Erythrobacter crassostrea]
MTQSRSSAETASLSRPSIWGGFAIATMAVAAIPLAALMAQAPAAPVSAFTVLESGRGYESLQQAVNAIGAQKGIIEIAPGTYRQCAVQTAGVIAYVARDYGTAVLDRTACEGKAALVLRGVGAEVRGVTFNNISVSDGNGAGIRLEKGSLNVAFGRFLNSQQGILTANNPNGRIFITRSTFSGLGTCENSAGCAHSIYTGDYGQLTVRESRFERGQGGHYLKARASNVVIENNSFDDANGRGTNYMIDLPAGSTGRITQNWFVQGRDKENYSAFIALGAEQNLHSSDGLSVTDNEARFVPGLRRASAFLADWTGSRVVMSGNRLADGLTQYEER